MPTMKWTDEAIERALKEYDDVVKSKCVNERCVSASMVNSVILELKRVRAWIKCIGCGTDCEWARMWLARCLSGDPAPSDEQEAK